jgi:tetratricopeptide (TPR) repeat protein
MSNDDDQKLRELERELESVLDEDSISEMLDGYQARQEHRPPTPPSLPSLPNPPRRENPRETLELDSEALIGAAPSSEAADDSPTVEAYVGEAPNAHMPEAGMVMRKRRDAGKHPAQPPPLPGDRSDRKQATSRGLSYSHRAPSKPPKISQPKRSHSEAIDLRPADLQCEKRWKLDQTPLSSVLLELATKTGLGLLEVRIGKRRAQLVVEDGRIFEVRLLPALAKRSLTSFLQRGGQLTAQKAAQFRRRAIQKGVSEAQALLEEPEFISSSVVRAAVCSRTRYLLRRLLDAKLSSAQYFALDDAPSAPMLVSVPLVAILFSHVRSSHSAKSSGRRDRARESFRGMHLSKRPNLAFSINQLGLKLHERQLIDRVLTKTRPFEKVLKNSPLAEDETVALLAALEAVGLLEVKAPGLCDLATSSWAEDYADTLERIELMEARLERENLFAIFGLHWTSYDADIARRYREMARLFEAANQPLGLSTEERKRVRSIKRRIDAIYERLSDSDSRERYRKKLIGSSTRAKAAKQLESLAEAALRRKAIHSALDYYQRLLEIHPTHKRASQLLPVLIARTTRR